MATLVGSESVISTPPDTSGDVPKELPSTLTVLVSHVGPSELKLMVAAPAL
jgi:hypothetical protein